VDHLLVEHSNGGYGYFWLLRNRMHEQTHDAVLHIPKNLLVCLLHWRFHIFGRQLVHFQLLIWLRSKFLSDR